TNSSINAFCIGGEKGINEIPEVTKIAKFYGINLLVDTVMSPRFRIFSRYSMEIGRKSL
ncbi:TPA: asparagine synthase, partial [Streptococcus pneumoniae]